MPTAGTAVWIPIIILFLSMTIAGQQNRSTEKATIEGIVVRAPSGEPLPRAEVTLRKNSDREQSEQETPRVLTTNDGKFSFRDLDPGQYILAAGRNGYARQIYGQHLAGSRPGVITLSAGQALKNLTLGLVQGGVVSGRIRDAVGQPVTGMKVYLLRSTYTYDGKRMLQETEGTFTDDRGEYRLYWIPPGRYYLSTGIFLDGKPDGLGPDVIADQVFPITYYPGVIDVQRALAIDIAAGAELGSMDVILPQPAFYRIRGRAIDSMTGRPPQRLDVGLQRRVSAESTVVEREDDHGWSYDSATGRFEIRGVSPGSYWLSAGVSIGKEIFLMKGPDGAGQTLGDAIASAFDSAASAQMAIDVTTADLNDVVLTLGRGVTIPIRLRIEGDQAPVARNLDEIEVGLSPVLSGLSARGTIRINPDGTATISNVSPGEYRVRVQFPEAMGLYVREANHERTDALNGYWQITGETTGILNVVLSSRGSQVEGTLRDQLNEPVQGAQVVLIPDQSRDRLDLYRRATTDASGKFSMRGIAPGGYKAFAWEALEDYAYYHRDVIAQYETQGIPVRVQEDSRETINVRLIPQDQTDQRRR